MTQKEIRQAMEEVLSAGIKSVLDGESKSFELKRFRSDTIPVSCAMVKDVMAKLGWKWEHEYEKTFKTNGWEYDWWMRFEKGSKRFTASGSGFYGGFHFGETEE